MEDAAVRVFDLFDLYWFRQQILLPPPTPSPPPPAPPMNPQPRLPLLLRRHCRALSNGSAPAPSASLSIQPPRRIPIPSGKEAPPKALLPPAPLADCAVDGNSDGERRQRGRRLRRTKSKSLTDLEFKELKGLIDLGFAFSHEENDPRLLKIVPGLRRSRAGGGPGTASLARPYLSEAWEARPEVDLLNNWRFQPPSGGGVSMKDQLRSWAHAVASTVVR
ncbi:gametogenetin-like [Zingiber officinale]|uniref:Uncharacterized protein n=1 Tax=Zingiber officinale TaxID=94328 RepID=A0A8J5L2J6_ZINOF|nr:gametogenetin-like [Zingiber officinale]KAG6502992.1 hypothetical protein ZIOFF_035281 [Zingiber officinale]